MGSDPELEQNSAANLAQDPRADAHTTADSDESALGPDGSTHKLLRRQLRRAGITRGIPTESQWRNFVERVDRAYREGDRNAAASDRRLDVSSNEMRARFDEVQQRADDLVAAEHARLQRIFGSVTTALVMFDRGGRIMAVNPEAQRLLGDHHAVVDHHLEDVLMIEDSDGGRHPLLGRADLDDVLSHGRWERHDVLLCGRAAVHVDAVDASTDDERPSVLPDWTAAGNAGPLVSTDVVIVPFAADDPELGGLVVMTDNAERERARQRLAWQATHDALTGLVNRSLLTERMDESLQRARRTGDWPSVVLLGLDRFKPVNDQLGHAAGDRLLTTVAERLQGCVRSADTVARLGGDEFVILCESAGDIDMVQALADRFLGTLSQPVDLAGEQRAVTASIGIAHGGPMYQSAGELLHDAHLAMAGSKQRGGNWCTVASDEMRVDAAANALLERSLRSAIARGEISVAYQPVQRTETGELVGFEALARWVHPVFGDVRPNRFVPVAIESGLIEALGDRMFDLACRDIATWNRERKAAGQTPLVVFINISGHDLRSPNLLTRVRDAMRRHSVLPSSIMLEMTESMLLDDPEVSIERLRELKRVGIRVAIDDFGTGHSAFSSLRRFPVHMVKIDREFIREIASSRYGHAIVKAMIDLAQGLDHEVLAEGVETAAELDALRNLGCGLVQGYLLGVPMPSEDALLLATSSRNRSPDPGRSASDGTAHLQSQP